MGGHNQIWVWCLIMLIKEQTMQNPVGLSNQCWDVNLAGYSQKISMGFHTLSKDHFLSLGKSQSQIDSRMQAKKVQSKSNTSITWWKVHRFEALLYSTRFQMKLSPSCTQKAFTEIPVFQINNVAY